MRMHRLLSLATFAAASTLASTAVAAPLTTQTGQLATSPAGKTASDCPPGTVRDQAAVDDAMSQYTDAAQLQKALAAIPCVPATTGAETSGGPTGLTIKSSVGVQPPRGIKPDQLQPRAIKPAVAQSPASPPK